LADRLPPRWSSALGEARLSAIDLSQLSSREDAVPLREVLERISSQYQAAKTETLENHPVADYIRQTATDEVQRVLAVSDRDLVAEGSPGRGVWAAAPWIAIFDPLVTATATRGYYLVYLFHTSEPIIHLSLNQGTTTTRNEFGRRTRQVLSDRAGFIRKRIADFADVLPVVSIDLGSKARLPGDYTAAHALGVSYRLEQLPPEEVLRVDLQIAIRAYRALTFRGGLELTGEGDNYSDDELATASLVERRQYRLHRRIERNPGAARLAKKYHGTRCQVCELDFGERYGQIGQGFIEAHHLRPISSLLEGAAVSYNVKTDFAVLCPNCHRMIHKTADPSDLQGFRELVRQ